MEHFWKIVFVIVILIGGYFWYDRWQAKNESERRMSQVLQLIENTKTLPKSASPERAGESLYRVLALLRRFETAGEVTISVLLDDVFNRAVKEGRLTNQEVPALRSALNANLRICEELGVFESDGVTMMEAGRAPTIRTGPFAKDKLIIGHLVPPTLAPEARSYFGNLVLTPESVFALQTDDVDRSIMRQAGNLRAIKAISHSSMYRIKRGDNDARGYRIGETN